MPVISLLTDFGSRDAYVGIMKGVILGICPTAQLIDLSHEVPPQQILPAALLLRSAVPFFPPQTIHLAVVDPGVGSDRPALLVECERGVLVGPDNGVLSLAAEALGRPRARVIAAGPYTQARISNTFHGRDIFAPVAAHLAAGLAPADCSQAVEPWVRLDVPGAQADHHGITGEVVYVDHFGNLVTNIDAERLSRFFAPELLVTIGATHIRGLASSYTAVAEGMPVAIVGSWGALEVAVRNGNAAQSLAARPGTPVKVVGGIGRP